jgi:hypothetical protein
VIYLVYTSRLIFGEEPIRVLGLIERDSEMLIDILTSGILQFPSGQCVFTCGTQIVPYQRVQFFGREGSNRDRNSLQCSARPTIVGYLSMMGLISPAVAPRKWSSRPATNTRFKVICFQKAYVRGASCLYRWRVLSRTWR